MKVSMWAQMRYLTPQNLPAGWPTPPHYYDPETGLQSYHDGIEQIELADRLGFDWISFSEHHYADISVAPHPALTAAAVAGRTKHAKLAVMGHVLPLNNPVRVAEELAMLDNITEGRLVVGLLRGSAGEFQVYGSNPAETRGQTLEGIDLVLRAWTEPQPFGWEGRYYRYRTVSVWPRPLQQPHPPLYALGASKESGALAARHHLGLGVALDRFDMFTDAYNYYREQCALAGWAPTADDIVYRGTIYVAESDEQADEDVRRFWSKPRGTSRRSASVTAAVESADPVSPGHGTPGRPQLNFLGSPETILRQVQECRQACGAGIIDFIFQGPGLRHEQVLQSIDLFGNKVLPRMHAL